MVAEIEPHPDLQEGANYVVFGGVCDRSSVIQSIYVSANLLMRLFY
ncbi:hypothetical protein GXM_01011 [Nostoc sphaeroides CCNUC1]|uniref:Uncharacterized protein n=1 Tax=Nostoc sphaeroides CCNUC1 TaxID=2653204 RepID=A0A5P8VSW2_9NOSO|nr:hypothetical protein GXM_01011 [Nostoc sphaeroides CCNUC1]